MIYTEAKICKLTAFDPTSRTAKVVVDGFHEIAAVNYCIPDPPVKVPCSVVCLFQKNLQNASYISGYVICFSGQENNTTNIPAGVVSLKNRNSHIYVFRNGWIQLFSSPIAQFVIDPIAGLFRGIFRKIRIHFSKSSYSEAGHPVGGQYYEQKAGFAEESGKTLIEEQQLNNHESIFFSLKRRILQYKKTDLVGEVEYKINRTGGFSWTYTIGEKVISITADDTLDNVTIDAPENIVLKSKTKLTLDSESILVGADAKEPAVLGDALKTWLSTAIVLSPAGAGNIDPASIEKFIDVLSQKVKVE